VSKAVAPAQGNPSGSGLLVRKSGSEGLERFPKGELPLAGVWDCFEKTRPVQIRKRVTEIERAMAIAKGDAEQEKIEQASDKTKERAESQMKSMEGRLL
jgi:hypothetical protein